MKKWVKQVLKTFQRRIPITIWIQDYTKSKLISDIIAGVTIALTIVPQSIAYATIVGLPPEYGLYSSYIGALIYVVLGSCRQASMGPTAIMSLVTFQTCGPDYPSCVLLVTFYVGAIQLTLAALHLSWIVNFISEPVTVGFTSGVAITCVASQLKSLLGIEGLKGKGFLGYLIKFFEDISTFKISDAIMGIGAFCALLSFRKLGSVSHANKHVKSFMWILSLASNMLVILITSLIGFFWGHPPFNLVGHVQGGFPSFALPSFHLPQSNCSSCPEHGLLESWQVISTGPLIIALLSILQMVAISKAFGSGQKVDATQEMIALGVSNIVGSFLSAIPACAAFSRSAVNEASGVKSTLNGLFSGGLVLLSLGFLTPGFYYIPKASLAAVIIVAVMFMVDLQSLMDMWKISKLDWITSIVTFLVSLLLGMEWGIVVGVVISLVILLRTTLQCKVSTEVIKQGTLSYLVISPSDPIQYPSLVNLSSEINKLCLKNPEINTVILNLENWCKWDYSAANTLKSIVTSVKKSGKSILIHLNRNEDANIEYVLKMVGIQKEHIIDCDFDIYLNDYQNDHPRIKINGELDSKL